MWKNTKKKIEEKVGFGVERSIVNYLFTIIQVLEKNISKNQKVLYIDFHKAFKKLWKTLGKNKYK